MIQSARLLAVVGVCVAGLAFGAEEKAAKGPPPTDPEIAHIAVTANQIDIDAGKSALARTRNPQVKEFAQRMIDDHTSVINQATELVQKLNVKPKDNATSRSLKSEATKTRATLGKKSGPNFDKAYIDNEVAYHQAVIDTVDKVLVPNAQNKELKTFLENVRPALVAHLDHAKKLQSDLAGGGGMGGSGHMHETGSTSK